MMKNHVMIVENFLSHAKCDELVHRTKERLYTKTHSFYGSGPEEFGPIKDFESEIRKDTEKVLEKYFEHYMVNSTHQEFNCVKIIKYSDGQSLPVHSDPERTPQGQTRTIGMILFLNDNFDGGELIFPKQEIIVTPEKGTLVVFPMSYMYPHLVNGVINGDRYVARINFFHR